MLLSLSISRRQRVQVPGDLAGFKQVLRNALENGRFRAPQTVNLSEFTSDILMNAQGTEHAAILDA